MATDWKSGRSSIPPTDDGVLPRARAAEIVFEVAYGGASLDTVLAGWAEQTADRDGALLRELSYGTLRWFWRSKGVVDQLVKRPLRKRDRIVEALMLVGIYQLDRMRLPPHAAIHTTVQCCAAVDRAGHKGLVNGVLRTYQRRRDELLAGLPAHAADAHPAWLWQAIMDQWPDGAGAVIEANNSRPPMTLRVNQRLTTRERYLAALKDAKIEAGPVEKVLDAVMLENPVGVERLPGFEQGRVSVQDASAQLLTQLISPRPGQRVLDACAAPGGKLTHMLESFPGIEAHAIEADPARAVRIVENLERLQLEAAVTVADAEDLDGWWDGRPFDLVVLDVPCSGTGVIRRHPDIKVLRRETDVDGFAGTQERLLNRLWATVGPGGRLIYVTCSILARENQEQVDRFLGHTKDCRKEAFHLPLGRALATGWQVLPQPLGGDGFYYAVLRKHA
jgi:16S rRNA (cytosine967-C5)-methyltransferase